MASGLPNAPECAIEEKRNRGRYSLVGEYGGDGLPSDLEGGEYASGKGYANPPRLSRGIGELRRGRRTGPSRLLKKAHLRRWRARAALRRTDQVRLAPAPILRMGTRRAALHLDLFEQPGQKRVFQHPARTGCAYSGRGLRSTGRISGSRCEGPRLRSESQRQSQNWGGR
jgi:hypothetical protein